MSRPKLEDARDIGMTWFTAEAWRELSTHPEAKIDDTYPQYLRRWERGAAAFAKQGIRAVKVPIDDIPLMVAWCHKHGYEINSKGRSVFCSALMLAEGKDVMSMPFHDNTRKVQ